MIGILAMLACSGSPPVDSAVSDTAPQEPREPGSYEHLLLFDLTSGAGGRTAGADIDSVLLNKPSGDYWAATVVDELLLGADNEHLDSSHALGERDSDCETNVFASLGGAGGYLLLSFGEGITIDNGDIITVFEVGSVMCPESGASDELWEIGAMDGTDLNDAQYIGQSWGMGEISVNTL